MDVMSMCTSPPNKSVPRKIPEFASISHTQSLPSPPLVNEKKGSPLPPLTSITSILHSPVPPLLEINPLPPPIIAPKPNHDASSSDTVANHNLYHQSSTPQSPPSRVNYLQPPESISQSMAHKSSPSSSYLLSPSTSHSPNDTTSMWSRQSQSPSLPTTSYSSYYRQSYPSQPPQPSQPSQSSQQYPYNSQSQQRFNVNDYSHPSGMILDYPPPYATSVNYNSSGNNVNGEDSDVPYTQQTTEQSSARMGKVVDHCNQIAHFASQYRDMRSNYNPWNAPQINESHLTDIINRAYDVLNILSSLKTELSRPPSVETNQNEIDLIRKQRTLGASARTKYRKRSKRAAPPGRCHSCNISETPEWRRGPDGARTLCNACGLHFAKITRKRALSAMQQAEQQQQQQATRSSNLTIPDNNGNNSSMLTPGTSDVESGSPHAKKQMIEILDD